MRIELPENQSEITLGKYQEYQKLLERKDLDVFDFSKRKLKVFTGLAYQDIEKIKQTDLEEMLMQIDKALEEESKFDQRFEMRGVKFGFIPNFDDIKAKEYFDLNTYETDPQSLHRLMAILFRPIKREIMGKYELVEYNGSDEWCEVMRLMPLNIANGALLFFCSLAEECLNYILRSMSPGQRKERVLNILKSGVGTQ